MCSLCLRPLKHTVVSELREAFAAPVVHPPPCTTEEMDPRRIPVQAHMSSGAAETGLDRGPFSQAGYFCFFPTRWPQLVQFCVVVFLSEFACAVICRSFSLTNDSKWLLHMPGDACRGFLDVACGHCYLNGAVPGLWYHSPLLQLKYRFPKERGGTLLREQ